MCAAEASEVDVPASWAHLSSVARLCVSKALQPQHLLGALREFVAEQLGPRFVASSSFGLAEILAQSAAEV